MWDKHGKGLEHSYHDGTTEVGLWVHNKKRDEFEVRERDGSIIKKIYKKKISDSLSDPSSEPDNEKLNEQSGNPENNSSSNDSSSDSDE